MCWDNDENTVEVHETEELLSVMQRTNLDQMMSRINSTNCLSETVLINQYTSERQYNSVIQTCSEGSSFVSE